MEYDINYDDTWENKTTKININGWGCLKIPYTSTIYQGSKISKYKNDCRSYQYFANLESSSLYAFGTSNNLTFTGEERIVSYKIQINLIVLDLGNIDNFHKMYDTFDLDINIKRYLSLAFGYKDRTTNKLNRISLLDTGDVNYLLENLFYKIFTDNNLDGYAITEHYEIMHPEICLNKNGLEKIDEIGIEYRVVRNGYMSETNKGMLTGVEIKIENIEIKSNDMKYYLLYGSNVKKMYDITYKPNPNAYYDRFYFKRNQYTDRIIPQKRCLQILINETINFKDDRLLLLTEILSNIRNKSTDELKRVVFEL